MESCEESKCFVAMGADAELRVGIFKANVFPEAHGSTRRNRQTRSQAFVSVILKHRYKFSTMAKVRSRKQQLKTVANLKGSTKANTIT